MDIILHIGLPKTGTSSIQNWVLGRSESLRSCGIYAVPTVMSAHRIAGEFVKDPNRAADEDVVAIRQHMPLSQVEDELNFAACQEDVKCAFVSSEYFYICDNGAVADFFKRLAFKVVKIIAYVRRQDLLASSGYNQDVKALKMSEPYVVGGFRPDYDYFALADSWQSAFPDAMVQLRNFDLLVERQSLIRQLADDIGCLEAYGERDEVDYRTNDSLSAELLEIVRISNSLGHFEVADLAIRAQCAGLPGNKFLLNSSTRKQIQELYCESNRKLVNYMGSSYADFVGNDDLIGVDCTNKFPTDTAVQLLSFAAKNIRVS